MSEINQVFNFTKELHKSLPLEEGKLSIYGVRPSSIFEGNNKSSSRIFQRPQDSDRHSDMISTQNSEWISQDFVDKTKQNFTFIGQKLGLF